MLNLVEGIYLGEAKEAEGFTGIRITKKLRIGGGTIPEANSFVTQSGDTIVTSAGTPLAIDGISSLTTAPSITDAQLTFADDGNSTVSFSMQQLKDYVSPAPAKQGRFVAASAAKFAYSDDGLTWTEVNNTSGTNKIAFGDGKFVAVSEGGYSSACSTDGVNWTYGDLSQIASDFRCIAYGNGKFVTAAYNSVGAAYSSDGITWIASTLPRSLYWCSMAFGNGLFVCINSSRTQYAYSSDGITWQSSTFPSGGPSEYNEISFVNNKFIVTGYNDSSCFISSDGINWTPFSMPSSKYWGKVAYGNSTFVTMGEGSNTAAYSSDGTNWTSSTLPTSTEWRGLDYGNNKFIITSIGSYPSFIDNVYAHSSDGITWTAGTLPSSQSWTSIAYGEITPQPTPTGTTLHQYDRVDGKATVADFWTDGNGQRYAVCVVDAQYRSGGQTWGMGNIETLLPNYTSDSAALAAGESGTWNTDTILNNYTASDYPAFNAARNACTVTVDNNSFLSCLPNAAELQMINTDKATLDTYDPTLTEYPNNSLTDWNMGSSIWLCWTSTEYSADSAWCLGRSGTLSEATKHVNSLGVIPIFEIPVDENGTVITN